MGRDRSVGLCGSLVSVGLYNTWCSGNRVKSKMNRCASINEDEFCLAFVVVVNPLIDLLEKG